MTVRQLSLFDDGYVEEPVKTRRDDKSLLPTPNTKDDLPPRDTETLGVMRRAGRGGYRNLRETVINDLPQTGNPPRESS